MNTQEKITLLESRQNELLKTIQNDGHAIRCQKTGQVFAEAYPEEYAQYQAAYAEYNENQAELEELYKKRKEEGEEKPSPSVEEA